MFLNLCFWLCLFPMQSCRFFYYYCPVCSVILVAQSGITLQTAGFQSQLMQRSPFQMNKHQTALVNEQDCVKMVAYVAALWSLSGYLSVKSSLSSVCITCYYLICFIEVLSGKISSVVKIQYLYSMVPITSWLILIHYRLGFNPLDFVLSQHWDHHLFEAVSNVVMI